jgi:predicted  nucleic acid-binding Zn-ribbon protein
MNQAHQSVKEEYKVLEDHLNKLDKDQCLIEEQLEAFSNELERLNKNTATYEQKSSGNMITRCKELNERMVKVDSEVEQMIKNFNQETHAPDRIEQDGLNVNVNIIMNNYFHTLRNLEMETLTVRKRLENVVERNNLR